MTYHADHVPPNKGRLNDQYLNPENSIWGEVRYTKELIRRVTWPKALCIGVTAGKPQLLELQD